MSVKITVPVDGEGGILRFYLNNIAKLEESQLLVAENTETGVEIYLTDDRGLPCFIVELDEDPIGEVLALKSTMAGCYEELIEQYIMVGPESENDSNLSEDDIDRINELYAALDEFLFVLLEVNPDDLAFNETDREDILSYVEEHLFVNYGVSTRHPTEMCGEVIQFPCDPEVLYETESE